MGDERPLRADLGIQVGLGRSLERVLGQRERRAPQGVRDPDRARRGAAELNHPARGAELLERSVGDGAEREPRGTFRPRRSPRVRLRGLGVRGEIEQEHAQLDGGDPVDHGVVDLPQDGGAAPRQLRHEDDLPQRPVAPQRTREERVGGAPQLLVVQRPRKHLDVVGEVEARVIAPHRLTGPEGHRGNTLPEARREVQAARDPGRHVDGVERVRSLGKIHRREPAHVHVGGRGLDSEEARVHRGQACHGGDAEDGAAARLWPGGQGRRARE